MRNYKHSFKKTFIYAIAPSLILYIIILIFTSAAGIAPGLVLRDLLQTCDLSVGVGMISSIGVLLWASASAITLFTLISNVVNHKSYNKLLIVGFFFSSLLCLDDLFLLHDMQQINQDFLYALYIFLTFYLLINFKKLILKVDPILFFSTIFLLGMSILSDIFQDFLPINYKTVQLFEEGFKFIGISCWLYFWSKVSRNAIRDFILQKFI